MKLCQHGSDPDQNRSVVFLCHQSRGSRREEHSSSGSSQKQQMATMAEVTT
jgi:hypothetical protein